MEIATLNIGSLKFPGRAGQLQRDGGVASLISELGDNYATYNGFLAGEIEKIGSRPEPADYTSYDAYAEACARLRDVLAAEVVIRKARGFRKLGRSLRDEDTTPLVDSAHRLVSADTGQRALHVAGSSAARRWRHVPITVP